MRIVPLQQICDIQIGKTPSRSVPEYWGGDLPWVTISDFTAGRIVTTTKERITRIGAEKSGSKRIPRGTLLLSFKLSLGKRTFSGCDLFTNEAIAALQIRDRDVADRDYLYWVLGSIDYDRLVDRAAKGKTLNKAKLQILQIPLPPLTEQKRIAGILDAADALRTKRREALAQLDTLLQSIFLDMFGDPVINPMRWRVGRLEDYFSKTRAGTCCGPFGSALKKHEYVDNGIPVWGIDNVKPNKFLQEQSLFITPEKFSELQRYSVESGDILISRAGTVGRMCVAVPTVNQSIIGTNLIRLTLNPGAMSPVYFASLYTFCRERLPGLRASGDDRSYSFLNTTRLKSLVLPLPPLDLQLRFAAIVESVEEQKGRQHAHLAELDTLFASLQSRAFWGDL